MEKKQNEGKNYLAYATIFLLFISIVMGIFHNAIDDPLVPVALVVMIGAAAIGLFILYKYKIDLIWIFLFGGSFLVLFTTTIDLLTIYNPEKSPIITEKDGKISITTEKRIFSKTFDNIAKLEEIETNDTLDVHLRNGKRTWVVHITLMPKVNTEDIKEVTEFYYRWHDAIKDDWDREEFYKISISAVSRYINRAFTGDIPPTTFSFVDSSDVLKLDNFPNWRVKKIKVK